MEAAEISFYSDGATYERAISRTVNGVTRKETVTLRPLQAGDRTDLQDEVRIKIVQDEADDEGGGATELRMGTMRILTVAKAIVSWSLPMAPSVSTVRNLHPDVFQQIYDEVTWGDVPTEPSAEEKKGSPLPDSNGSSETPGADTNAA